MWLVAGSSTGWVQRLTKDHPKLMEVLAEKRKVAQELILLHPSATCSGHCSALTKIYFQEQDEEDEEANQLELNAGVDPKLR